MLQVSKSKLKKKIDAITRKVVRAVATANVNQNVRTSDSS